MASIRVSASQPGAPLRQNGFLEIEMIEDGLNDPARTPETLLALIATLEHCLATLDQLALHEAAARCDEVLLLCRLAQQSEGER